MTPTARHPVHLFCRFDEDDPSSETYVGEFDTTNEAVAFYRAAVKKGTWYRGAAVVREHCWFARVVAEDGLRIAPEEQNEYLRSDVPVSASPLVLDYLLKIVRRRLDGHVRNRVRTTSKRGPFVPKVGSKDMQAEILSRLGTVEALIMDGIAAGSREDHR